MLKKFRKVTILALALVMIFAMSASAFAVSSWSHIWNTSDPNIKVEYYAEITANDTWGTIDSWDNQGEVTVNADIRINSANSAGAPRFVHRYDVGTYFAGVYEACSAGETMGFAEYYFYASVGSTGDEFESECITLLP